MANRISPVKFTTRSLEATFAVLLTLSTVVSCNSLPKITALNKPSVSSDVCSRSDWYEVGRLDGIQGLLQQNKSAEVRCQSSLDPEAYEAGWNHGIIEYCTQERGFDVGRRGLIYLSVCPDKFEPDFLRGFQSGNQARLLEQKNLQIDLQIESQRDLARTPASESKRPGQLVPALDLESLRNERRKNEAQIQTLENARKR